MSRAEQLEAEVAALRAGGAAATTDDDGFWVPERHGQRRVPIEAIDWIEAARDYVLLHTALRSHLLRITMAALEERLAGSPLLRVHRSAFVRPDRVSEVRREGPVLTLVLADGAEVQVGPSYVAAARDAHRVRIGRKSRTTGAGGSDPSAERCAPSPASFWPRTARQTRTGWEVTAAVSISALRNAAATHEDRVRKCLGSHRLLPFFAAADWRRWQAVRPSRPGPQRAMRRRADHAANSTKRRCDERVDASTATNRERRRTDVGVRPVL